MTSHRNAKTNVYQRQMLITRVRRQGWTQRQAAEAAGVITRVLHRAGVNRVSRLEPPPVIQRYEWPHAGDLLHLDIKPLSRIRGVGHRIHGDRAGSLSGSPARLPGQNPSRMPSWTDLGAPTAVTSPNVGEGFTG
jgi:hypothetical protein